MLKSFFPTLEWIDMANKISYSKEIPVIPGWYWVRTLGNSCYKEEIIKYSKIKQELYSTKDRKIIRLKDQIKLEPTVLFAGPLISPLLSKKGK